MPSKKFAFAIGSIVVVLVVWYAVFNADGLRNGTVIFERTGSVMTGSEEFAKDTDGDGLADWEEALWKTDPGNPDTDGDGTSDGEEVGLKRDPTIKGPGDGMKKGDVVQAPKSSSGQQPLNETDVFMRELLGKYFELKGSGNTDAASIQELARLLADDLVSKGVSPAKTYRVTDISTSNDSISSLRSYGESIGAMFAERSLKESELQILSDALSSGDAGTIEELFQFEREYAAMVVSLLSIKAPPSLALAHLGFVNEFGKIASAAGAMANTLTNPILGLSGISQYQKSLKIIEENMAYVGSIFNNRGVIFERGEDGYLFISTFKRLQ